MVQKSGIIKRFLAGTHSNQILYLNSVSESEKIYRRFQKFMFPREWSNGSTGNSTLKSLNIIRCGLRFIPFMWKQLPFTFSCQIVQSTTKSVLFEALLVPARKTFNTKL